MSEQSFEQMLNESFKTIHTGEVVSGTVLDVKEDQIILNIGYKSDGVITRNEYTNNNSLDLRTVVHVGDELEAKVMKVNDGDGQVSLSYRRLAADRGNKRLEEAFNNHEVLKAKVVQVLNGGLSVLVDEARVFIPASLVSDSYERDLNKYADQEIEFVITEFNPRRRRIIGDRKQLMQAAKAELQKELFQEQLTLKHEGRPTSSYLLLCEHEPVFTMGKHADKANVLLSPEHLRDMGYDFYEIERGGDVTYHGPGQITGYPILDLERFGLGLRAYIELLESSIIELLRFYGIRGELKEGAAGVWLDVGDPERERKIAAIGVKSSRYVTMHGFALNVTNDLSPFQLINPCGFKQGKVASIAGETGQAIDLVVIRHMLVSFLHRRLRELMPQRY